MMMIETFACKETKKIFHLPFSRKLRQDIQRVARRRLGILDAAEVLQDLRIPPSNRLENLSGDRQGQYSIRINDRWRICFEWQSGDAYNVEISERFWINLQAWYNLETEKDRLKDRLDKEVRVYAMAQ
jgi:proteic killer suppression protein